MRGVNFPRHNQYGETCEEQATEVLLAKPLLKKPKFREDRYRKVFLVYVTILHERAHGKNFQFGTGESPRKVFPTPQSAEQGESGDWLEVSLFGGIVYSVSLATDVSGTVDSLFAELSYFGGGLFLRLPNHATHLIPDTWIQNFVCVCLTSFFVFMKKVEAGISGAQKFPLRRFKPLRETMPPASRRSSRKTKLEEIRQVKLSGGYVDAAGWRHKF